jgi:hypothetical protein
MSTRRPVRSRRQGTALSAQAKRGKQLYDARRRAVQPLVSFRIPSYAEKTDHWRKKLKNYYSYLLGADGLPGIADGVVQKVKRRSPEALAALQRQFGQGRLRGIKYAFIPSVTDPETGVVEPVDIIARDGAPDIIQVGDTFQWSEPFDLDALMEAPQAEIARVADLLLSQMPNDRDAARFRIMNGGGENESKTVPGAHTRRSIIERVMYLLNRYDTGSAKVRRDGKRWWGNWMWGLQIVVANNQYTLQEFEDAKEVERDRHKQIRKIKLAWLNALDALVQRGGSSPTEAVAYIATGATDDPTMKKTLTEMRKAKLVTGDTNRWTITQQGREYLQRGEAARRLKL